MKTLQNNFTTPEQSQRLLELGLPVDSADCILRHYNWADEDLKEENWETPAIINNGISPSEAMDMFLDDEYDMTMPCWSVGRLIEIDLNCRNKDYCLGRGLAVKNYDIPLWENGNYSICDYCVDEFIARIELGDYDFSKLED